MASWFRYASKLRATCARDSASPDAAATITSYDSKSTGTEYSARFAISQIKALLEFFELNPEIQKQFEDHMKMPQAEMSAPQP
jgi:hypothetical protein